MTQEAKIAQAYRSCLLAFSNVCKSVAESMSLSFRMSEDQKDLFTEQATDGSVKVQLPMWEIFDDEISIKFDPDALQQDFQGKHSGIVWVNRFRNGERKDCPVIWARVQPSSTSEEWYEGARGNTSKLVTEAVIRQWLTVLGPKPA